MKMGIERVLREKFGDTLKEVVQVDNATPGGGGEASSLTLEAARAEVDRMLQAMTAMGEIGADIGGGYGIQCGDNGLPGAEPGQEGAEAGAARRRICQARQVRIVVAGTGVWAGGGGREYPIPLDVYKRRGI